MRRATAPWLAFGLDEDEWRDCEMSAREVSRATGLAVSVHEVAAEYVEARAFEELALAAIEATIAPEIARAPARPDASR